MKYGTILSPYTEMLRRFNGYFLQCCFTPVFDFFSCFEFFLAFGFFLAFPLTFVIDTLSKASERETYCHLLGGGTSTV